jgi:hypothetical protein
MDTSGNLIAKAYLFCGTLNLMKTVNFYFFYFWFSGLGGREAIA